MQDVYLISDLGQLKAISDPRRLRLIKALADAPLTTGQLATRLGDTINRVHYHVKELEQIGLIHVVEERQRGHLMEKLYEPVAAYFRVDPTLFVQQMGNVGQAGQADDLLFGAAHGMFDAALSDLKAAARTGRLGPSDRATRVLPRHSRFRLTPEQATAFQQRLQALMDEYSALDDPRARAQVDLTLLFVTLTGDHLPAAQRVAEPNGPEADAP